MADLSDVSTGDIITSTRANLVNDYIQDGVHCVNALSLELGGTLVLTDALALQCVTTACMTTSVSSPILCASTCVVTPAINLNGTTCTSWPAAGTSLWADGTDPFIVACSSCGICVPIVSATTCVSAVCVKGTTAGCFGGTIVSGSNLEINNGGSGNRYAYIDFHGDDTYTDYALRIIREAGGVNSNTDFIHRGTGSLGFATQDAGVMTFKTTNTVRMCIAATGAVLSCICHQSPILCATSCVKSPVICATTGFYGNIVNDNMWLLNSSVAIDCSFCNSTSSCTHTCNYNMTNFCSIYCGWECTSTTYERWATNVFTTICCSGALLYSCICSRCTTYPSCACASYELRPKRWNGGKIYGTTVISSSNTGGDGGATLYIKNAACSFSALCLMYGANDYRVTGWSIRFFSDKLIVKMTQGETNTITMSTYEYVFWGANLCALLCNTALSAGNCSWANSCTLLSPFNPLSSAGYNICAVCCA